MTAEERQDGRLLLLTKETGRKNMRSLKIRRISAVMLCAAMMMSCMSIFSLADEIEETETARCPHEHPVIRQEVGQAVTCEENGYHTAVTVCEDCGEELERERITDPAPGHAYKSTEKDPTCTEDGKIIWTCARCGDQFSEKGKEKLGHQYEVSARTESTYEEEGSVTWTCVRCGNSRSETLPKAEKPAGQSEKPEQEDDLRNDSEEEERDVPTDGGPELTFGEEQDSRAGGEVFDSAEGEKTGDGQDDPPGEGKAEQPEEEPKDQAESAAEAKNEPGRETKESESGRLPAFVENKDLSVDPDSTHGIVTAVSGGLVSRISVVWNTDLSSDGRTLLVYGRSEAYESAEDLYDSAKQGVLLGKIVCGESSELTVSGDYAYFGIFPADGALCVKSIAVEWR